MQLHASTQHNRSILEHGRSTGQHKQSRHPYHSVQCAALQTQSSKGSNSNDVIERRAADVIVVGCSAAGLAAAYTLAKRGRKVLVLEDWGLDSAVSGDACCSGFGIMMNWLGLDMVAALSCTVSGLDAQRLNQQCRISKLATCIIEPLQQLRRPRHRPSSH